MARKCSHCGNNGHNSRTCSNPRSMVGGGGLRLFGVQLHIASPMRKSFSMDCLSSSSISRSSSSTSLVSIDETADKLSNGYISDGLIGRNQERKKGVPWTEEEHRTFLAGLEKLGKGDWRGISRNFVTTRTPTQVASHAQKYFLRQSSLNKKKRRSSLFDVVGSYERAVHITESSKFKDPSSFCDLQSPALYLNAATNQVVDDAPIDLNSSEQETPSPSCLHLLPSCPAASLGSSPSHVTKPSNSMSKPNVHLPDLELTISSSRSPLDQNKSDHPASLRMGTIRVI